MSSLIPFQTFPPSLNLTTPSPRTTSFSLSPDPSYATDIWRKPTNPISNPTDPIFTFNAPIIYKSIPLSKFKRARVTFEATYQTLFDQGGLILVLPSENGTSGVEDIAETSKWMKTGIEFVENKIWVGTVGCDRWADWSLADAGIRDGKGEGRKIVTIELEREKENGTLWVYAIGEDGGRTPLREITWILSPQGNGGSPDREAWVGIYAATPILEGRDKNGALCVEFRDWELELEE
ncbi:uncharacterized protein RAG0_14583 [Rhynchosporium agropyri]|uniref:Beta-xylosidase C-terminal Concanavalin A-like domain-containing protein n=1 Tax=Rhynchosporium agropyri TaxID=914238 RepID=A0A1E1LJJ9_9HELO|nr:uncharacterized protein RAG0_14583 [Rhynchosporium agropyri]